MIATKELRIGNWVHLKESGAMQWEIDDFDIYCTDEKSTNDFIEPILISSQILQKSGFKEHYFYSDQPAYKKGKYFVIKNWFQAIVGENAAVILNQDMRYIHQLQNIWFALENEELQVIL